MPIGNYSISSVIKGMRNPELAYQELRRIYRGWALRLNNRFYNTVNSFDEIDMMSEDWDTLVLLDACRYDFFTRCEYPQGVLQPVYSPASESWEFMIEQFVGKQFHDTVYVTANPHAYKLPDDIFFMTVNLLDDHWDSDERTVLPSTMVEETLRIADEYPNKKIVLTGCSPTSHFSDQLGVN